MKEIIIVMVLALFMLVIGCKSGHISKTNASSPTIESLPTVNLPEASSANNTYYPTTESSPTVSLPVARPADDIPLLPNDNNTITQNKANDITQIPYYGDHEKFNLSVEHALAYAESIKNAELDIGELYFNFDILYPVLIDVTGDGVPLLLLVEKANETGAETGQWGSLPLHLNLLFGYKNGELQKIAQFMGIGIELLNDERLLSVGWVTDFGGSYDFYRINNGAAEFTTTMRFVADWHGGTPHGEISIDGEEFSPEEYWAVLETIPAERLMDKGHPGNVEICQTFEEYLSQSFTREQAMQIFLDYAEQNIIEK